MRLIAVLRLSIILSLLVTLSACGGSSKSSASSTVAAAIAITPNPMSMDFGQVQNISASVTNAAGTVLSTVTVTFASSDETLVTVATNGLVCAGQWDSKTTPVVCT